jgi:hypothetical protein
MWALKQIELNGNTCITEVSSKSVKIFKRYALRFTVRPSGKLGL